VATPPVEVTSPRENVNCLASNDPKGGKYIGTLSRTEENLECQAWAAQTPHKHGVKKTSIPDKDLNKAKNYCRNPNNGSKSPWCYTMDPKKRIGYCKIPKC